MHGTPESAVVVIEVQLQAPDAELQVAASCHPAEQGGRLRDDPRARCQTGACAADPGRTSLRKASSATAKSAGLSLWTLCVARGTTTSRASRIAATVRSATSGARILLFAP